MALNRKIQPQGEEIGTIDIIQAKKSVLDNGIPYYSIDCGNNEVVKLDFIFPAGLWYQKKPFVASTTSMMLQEGTSKKSSVEIAEILDYYGAYLHLNVERDFAFVSLFSLNKYLDKTLDLVEDILFNPVFPEKELSTYIMKKKQILAVEFEKVKVLARKKFDNVLFGHNHPYGQQSEIADFDNIKQTDIVNFFKQNYYLGKCRIIASGKLDRRLQTNLNKRFGQQKVNIVQSDDEVPVSKSAKEKVHVVEKTDAVQNAIRVGRVLFNKKHPDFMGLQVLNTVLGGYFGSRLMANIREDKGYTYGIGSFVVSMRNSGYFTVSSEVGADVCKDALNEVKIEIKRLQEDLIPDKELDRVRNYLLGEVMRSIEGPFALSDNLWSLLEYNMDYAYFDKFIDVIKTVTPSKLRDLAGKYLSEESLYEVIAGKYD